MAKQKVFIYALLFLLVASMAIATMPSPKYAPVHFYRFGNTAYFNIFFPTNYITNKSVNTTGFDYYYDWSKVDNPLIHYVRISKGTSPPSLTVYQSVPLNTSAFKTCYTEGYRPYLSWDSWWQCIHDKFYELNLSVQFVDYGGFIGATSVFDFPVDDNVPYYAQWFFGNGTYNSTVRSNIISYRHISASNKDEMNTFQDDYTHTWTIGDDGVIIAEEALPVMNSFNKVLSFIFLIGVAGLALYFLRDQYIKMKRGWN